MSPLLLMAKAHEGEDVWMLWHDAVIFFECISLWRSVVGMLTGNLKKDWGLLFRDWYH
jgi:hypothetical protein